MKVKHVATLFSRCLTVLLGSCWTRSHCAEILGRVCVTGPPASLYTSLKVSMSKVLFLSPPHLAQFHQDVCEVGDRVFILLRALLANLSDAWEICLTLQVHSSMSEEVYVHCSGNSELWLAFIFKQILITLWSLNTSVLLSEFVITDKIVHNYTIVYLSTIVSLHRTASMKWSSMCFSWTDWLSQSCLATPPDNTCSRFNYSFQISLWLLDCSIGTDRIGAYCRRYVVWPL